MAWWLFCSIIGVSCCERTDFHLGKNYVVSCVDVKSISLKSHWLNTMKVYCSLISQYSATMSAFLHLLCYMIWNTWYPGFLWKRKLKLKGHVGCLFFFLIYLFIYSWLRWVFVAACGLSLVVFSSCCEQGLLFVAVHGLLIAVASLVAESRGVRASVVVACGLWSAGSAAVAHGLSCSVACEIFPDQGSNPCPLHWQVVSQPLHHQGSPCWLFLRDGLGNGISHSYLRSGGW